MGSNWTAFLIRYRAILSLNAQDDLRRLFDNCPSVLPFVRSQLMLLEESPTSLSTRSHFPFREKCQLMSFDKDEGDTRHFIHVLFQFGADEQTLHILDIAHHPRKLKDLLDP